MKKSSVGCVHQKKFIAASPVYQKPEILEAFLKSLKALKRGGAVLDYIFVDDNVDEESSRMLANFQREGSKTIVFSGQETTAYICDEESHHWDDNLMLKVANYKNTMISYAVDNVYDGIFFVDSDLILHPGLLQHLQEQKKEVVSEIFWSRWHDGLPLEPNVWLFDEYDLVPKRLGEELTEEEKVKRQGEYLEKLKFPGLYRVGGLGACTLISRSALLKGVNFAPIENLTIHGEDRFFCIRAAVLGIGLFVDTRFPAYHIYRELDLEGVDDYVKQSLENPVRNQITLSMVVKNEEGRYLERVLQSLAGHIHNAVIIDDASTDGTVELCKRLLGKIPLKIIRNQESMFTNEVGLRKKQWEETIKENPQWILNLDADEIIEEGFWDAAKEMLDQPDCGRFDFRLYDMWNETQYREDAFWCAHKSLRTFLIRYDPEASCRFLERPQHCGRFPINCTEVPRAIGQYRIQHMGWATQKDRVEKYKRYKKLDPGAVYGVEEQYESILDQEPRLLTWKTV